MTDVCLLLEQARLRRLDRSLDRGDRPADPADAELRGVPNLVARRSPARGLAAALLLALLAACRGPVQPYEPLSPDAANLRAQFNADAGKVRILLLPAPT